MKKVTLWMIGNVRGAKRIERIQGNRNEVVMGRC